ncbi:MAG: ATP-dependent DNA helicase [Candidatus Omnitrophica bacterium]|nr:ATP-dependent DNA helicase [Candidatus Omnitrophota bacterium]
MKFYEQLNTKQKIAVDTIEGPLLVLAGPGTGKTQLLSVRAASILRKTDIRPENILILTYTNPAAKAMKERLASVIGPSGYDVEVGTFHSFANSMLQESVEAANYIGDKILMDEVEHVKVIEYILNNTDGLDEIRPFRSPYTYLKDILKKISDMKKDDVTPEDLKRYLKDKKSHYLSMEEKYINRLKALSIVYERYEEIKEAGAKGLLDERGRYDFDDMIIFAVMAIRKEENLRKEYRDRYKYIMVDEYQDTNGAQLDLLFELAEGAKANICCVGDDDQSIYRFQGANIDNFKRLEERFPAIEKVFLTDNYRSSGDLIAASGKISHLLDIRVADKTLNSVRRFKDKELTYREFSTEEEELLYITDRVKELKARAESDAALSAEERKHPYNGIAVLVRKRDHILKIIDAFLRQGIPYATDGKEDIGQEKRVGQLLDVLQLAHIDPIDTESKDTALYKVLAADYFRIPQADLLRFINYAYEKRKRAPGSKTLLTEFLSYFSSEKDDLRLASPEKSRRAFEAVKRLLRDAYDIPVHTLLINFIKDAGIYKYILKEYSDNGILRIRQLRSIGSFINMVKRSDLADPAIRLGEFLSEIETRKNHGIPIQGDLVTLTQEGVRVYTAHGSKGLEFRSVMIPFCLQNKNWPARAFPDKIPLPFDLFKNKREYPDKDALKKLSLQDETRLFYVAMTRAKSDLIFTASPSEDNISSSYLDKLGISKDGAKGQGEDEETLVGKSLKITDLEDPFIGTDEVLKDMISSLTLNPTRLNNYITCRRKFLYDDILKLPGQKKKSLVFGNCVHKALEETYREYMDKRVFPSLKFFQDAFRRELKFQGVDKSMENDCLNKMKTLKGWFDRESMHPVVPIDLEKKLMITIGDNIIFTGKYDKVEWEDEDKGLVRILDYKTGKPDNHIKNIDQSKDLASADCDGYLRQLAAYKLLFERDRKESRGRKAASLTLVFIEPVSANIARSSLKKGDYISKSVYITDEMVAELEGIIKDVWSDIKKLRFEKLKTRDENICAKCDFDNICWR